MLQCLFSKPFWATEENAKISGKHMDRSRAWELSYYCFGYYAQPAGLIVWWRQWVKWWNLMSFPLDSSWARLVWFTQAPCSCSKQFSVQVQLAQGVTPHISASQSCLLLSLFLCNCIFNSSSHCFCSLHGDTAICSITSAFARSLLCPPLFVKSEWTFPVFGIQNNWKGWERMDWQCDFIHLPLSLFFQIFWVRASLVC